MEGNDRYNYLVIIDIIKNNTNENRLLKQEEIQEIFESQENFLPNIKTIAKCIQEYNLFFTEHLGKDEPIKHVPRKGYYYADKVFSDDEVKFLIDAIYSSKSLGFEESRRLEYKLKTLLPKSQISFSNAQPKIYKQKNSSHKYIQTLKSINTLSEAIEKNYKVSFKLIDYDDDGKQIEKFSGKESIVSPYYILSNNGRYYLIGYNETSTKDVKVQASPYRIDFLTSIKILDGIDIDLKIKDKIMGDDQENILIEKPYMFLNKTVDAKLLIENPTRIRDVFDEFTNPFISVKEGKIYASVSSDEDALYYWCMQFCNEIKVIKPISLRNKIEMTFKRVLQEYSNIPYDNQNIKVEMKNILKESMSSLKIGKEFDKFTNLDYVNYISNYLLMNTNKFISIENKDNILNVSFSNNDKEKYQIFIDVYNEIFDNNKVNNIINNINKSYNNNCKCSYYVGIENDNTSSYSHNENKGLAEFLSDNGIKIKWIRKRIYKDKWLRSFIIEIKNENL